MMHGEADRNSTTYKADLLDYIDRFTDDYCVGVLGQELLPLWVIHTPSKEPWATDHQRLPQAQMDIEAERPNVVIAYPTYALQNGESSNAAGGGPEHPTANGSREAGYRVAKAIEYHFRGQNFFCPRMVAAARQGRTAYIGFAALHYPIVNQSCWLFNSYQRGQITNLGFYFTDDNGSLPGTATISSEYDSLVEVAFDRDPVGTVTAIYAGETNSQGRGNIADSDNYVTPFEYLVDPAGNQYPGEDVASERDRPYLSNNWALPQAFVIPAA